MIAVCVRSVVMFLALLAVTRCMGKRELGSLQPFEFVLTLLLADLAVQPLEAIGKPLWEGLLPLAMMLLLQLAFSFLSARSARFQTFLCGQPALVIAHGTVNEKMLENLRYSVSDLMAQIRCGGFAGPHEVEYAVLETNGQLNLIPKPPCRPLTRADMQLPDGDAALPYALVEDGEIRHAALRAMGRDEAWLRKRLEKEGCPDARQILYALYLADGTLALQKRESRQHIRRIRP